MFIHNLIVRGTSVDAETRCVHYHSDLDIIAIKFRCCGEWFPCFECHAEYAARSAQTWATAERQTKAVLCGACGYQLTIEEYFNCKSICPRCERRFNPGCARHYHLYFEVLECNFD